MISVNIISYNIAQKLTKRVINTMIVHPILLAEKIEKLVSDKSDLIDHPFQLFVKSCSFFFINNVLSGESIQNLFRFYE